GRASGRPSRRSLPRLGVHLVDPHGTCGGEAEVGLPLGSAVAWRPGDRDDAGELAPGTDLDARVETEAEVGEPAQHVAVGVRDAGDHAGAALRQLVDGAGRARLELALRRGDRVAVRIA